MKFLIDTQLPRRFCSWLVAVGHDATHTLDLPQRNCTTDREILDIAEQEDRIVVTMDDDFVQSFLRMPVYRARERNAGDSRMIGNLPVTEGETGVANTSGNRGLSLRGS